MADPNPPLPGEEEPTRPSRAEGEPLDRSDADLDRLAEIDREAIREGVNYWQEHAPRRYKGLADAEASDEEGEEGP